MNTTLLKIGDVHIVLHGEYVADTSKYIAKRIRTVCNFSMMCWKQSDIREMKIESSEYGSYNI